MTCCVLRYRCRGGHCSRLARSQKRFGRMRRDAACCQRRGMGEAALTRQRYGR